MIFLALVPSPPYVAIRCRELLPRGFTLTFSGGLFSVTASIRLLPSVLSTAGCPFQSGLSSESLAQRRSIPPVATAGAVQVQSTLSLRNSATEASYLYFNELFITEFPLDLVIFHVKTFDLLAESRGNVFAMFVALH